MLHGRTTANIILCLQSVGEQQPGPVPEGEGRGVQAEDHQPGQGPCQGLQEGPPQHQAQAGLSPQAGEKVRQGDSAGAPEGAGQCGR